LSPHVPIEIIEVKSKTRFHPIMLRRLDLFNDVSSIAVVTESCKRGHDYKL
jgi:hypothetical protein